MNLTLEEAFAFGVLVGVMVMGGAVGVQLLFVNGWWWYWTEDKE